MWARPGALDLATGCRLRILDRLFLAVAADIGESDGEVCQAGLSGKRVWVAGGAVMKRQSFVFVCGSNVVDSVFSRRDGIFPGQPSRSHDW